MLFSGSVPGHRLALSCILGALEKDQVIKELSQVSCLVKTPIQSLVVVYLICSGPTEQKLLRLRSTS